MPTAKQITDTIHKHTKKAYEVYRGIFNLYPSSKPLGDWDHLCQSQNNQKHVEAWKAVGQYIYDTMMDVSERLQYPAEAPPTPMPDNAHFGQLAAFVQHEDEMFLIPEGKVSEFYKDTDKLSTVFRSKWDRYRLKKSFEHYQFKIVVPGFPAPEK